MKKYHCFYREAVGNAVKYQCFDYEDEAAKLVKRANDPNDFIRELRVVYGDLIEFEPVDVVTVWRAKPVTD